MIKLFRKIRRCWFIILSFFDREFIARALNIHHPSELKAWNTFNTTLRKDYDEYCSVREELREWHWLMSRYGCSTIKEFENLIKEIINRPNNDLDEIKAAAELKGRELSKWFALARKNQVDFLCKSIKPADPQYVDEWFRFKKMF